MDSIKVIEKILEGREKRVKSQGEIIERNNSNLISFTVNSPGIEKNNEKIKNIFDSGLEDIEHTLNKNNIEIIELKIFKDKESGPEAFIAFNDGADKVKKLAIRIEKSKLGRLYDIDVLTKDKKSLSRRDLGYDERKCIVCGENAKYCARSRRHDIKQVVEKFYEIFDKTYI